MSWRNRTIKILSKEEIEKRYPKESSSRRAKLTKGFLEKGFDIVYLKMDGLGKETPSCRRMEVYHALEIVLETDNFQIGCYTDMSELKDDVIYVAVKEVGGPKNFYH